MSQAEARAWWADVEHLREAAERRQAADARRRTTERRRARDGEAGGASDPEQARARARAATRLREQSGGTVDELTARRAVTLDERAPRSRRPAPIWLAEEPFADPVAAARARASAPRRTVEIRGHVMPVAGVAQAVTRDYDARPLQRSRHVDAGLAGAFAARPDRMAFWAFVMGLALALAAGTSAGA